jgi:hypothetical protein
VKRLIPSLFLIFCLVFEGKSQEMTWNAGLYTFFDNVEFGGSAFKIPQTMSGVQFIPEISLLRDSIHKLDFGINLLHEFGSEKAIDKLYPTAYYEYDKKPFRFLMGAMPRSEVLYRYPRLFFQDSISYYRPNVNGIFIELFGNRNYIDAWLDWTGKQSETVNESFFVGISGRYNFGPLYIRHSNYMLHFAHKMNKVEEEVLHDNLLFLTSAGVDLSGNTHFNKLEANIGWVGGAERARTGNSYWILKTGFLAEIMIEYKFIGLFSSFYKGAELMNFYSSYGNDLYWGDPAYRADTYTRTDLYLRLLHSNIADLELTCSLHFLESRVYNEQMLKVRINLNNR